MSREQDREMLEKASTKYRPSNGTEGCSFIEEFCAQCQVDAPYRDSKNGLDGCQILAKTFCYEVTDPEYPEEWTYNDKGSPVCTAFVPEGEPIPYRCEMTSDMFAAAAMSEGQEG